MSYPKIIKEAALGKLFHTDLSLRHIADELGIPRATLHGWKRKYQVIKSDSETINTPAESWTPEEKFAVRMLEAPDQQLSLTDPDARSMKSRGGGIVGYNVQTAVESITI